MAGSVLGHQRFTGRNRTLCDGRHWWGGSNGCGSGSDGGSGGGAVRQRRKQGAVGAQAALAQQRRRCVRALRYVGVLWDCTTAWSGTGGGGVASKCE